LAQADSLEKSIARLKLDLSKISEERWRAALSRDHGAVSKARVRAAEKTLENCSTISKYVANFSAPLAREISRREEEARRTFEQVRNTADPELFHRWIKQQLIPSTALAEKLGHLAASASNPSATPQQANFHRWTRN